MTDETLAEVQYVADAGTSARLAQDWTTYQLTRPATWLPYPFVVLSATFIAVLSGQSASGIVAFAIGGVLVSVCGILYTAWRLSSGLSRSYRAGATYAATVALSALTLTAPGATSTVSYGEFSSVAFRNSAVIIRYRSSRRMASVLPRELFPGNAAQLLSERIAAAGPQLSS